MENFKIEKNIPLPTQKNRRVYPFYDMEVNDSFLVNIENNTLTLTKRQNVYMSMWRFCKKHPQKKFVTSTEKEGIRIWRIK